MFSTEQADSFFNQMVSEAREMPEVTAGEAWDALTPGELQA